MLPEPWDRCLDSKLDLATTSSFLLFQDAMQSSMNTVTELEHTSEDVAQSVSVWPMVSECPFFINTPWPNTLMYGRMAPQHPHDYDTTFVGIGSLYLRQRWYLIKWEWKTWVCLQVFNIFQSQSVWAYLYEITIGSIEVSLGLYSNLPLSSEMFHAYFICAITVPLDCATLIPESIWVLPKPLVWKWWKRW